MTRFTVNNQPVEYRLDPKTPLLWALRDASNLTGTKYGCGTGHCGACIVDVDGAAVASCQVAIGAVEGTFVTTIEGLSRDRTHPVQQAFVELNVSQCGYCIPGFIMAAAVLIEKNRDPSEQQIKEAITNICRCGIYPRVVDAVIRAAEITRGAVTAPLVAPPDITPAEAAEDVPALTAPRK